MVRNTSCIRSRYNFRPYSGSSTIGENCTINNLSHISGAGHIEIYNNALIVAQYLIASANRNFDNYDLSISQQDKARNKIVL